MMGKWRLLQEHFWGNSYHRLEVLCDATYKLLKTFLTTLDRNTCYMNMSLSNIRSWLKEPLVCLFACSFCLFLSTIFLKVFFYVYVPNLFKWYSLANYSVFVHFWPRRVGYSQKNLVEAGGPRPKTLNLFMTKICDFPYPIYDQTENLIPCLWPLWLTQTKFLKKGGKF